MYRSAIDCEQENETEEMIDEQRLCEAAEALRPGHKCLRRDDGLKVRYAGGSNVHVPMNFEDGVRWLARIRSKRDYCPPPPAMAMNVSSEAATLQALRSAGVRVSMAWLPKHFEDCR